MTTRLSICAGDAEDMVWLAEHRGHGPLSLSYMYWQYSESSIQRTLAYYKEHGVLQQHLPSRRADHRALTGREREFILSEYALDCTCFNDEIADAVLEKFGRRPSESTIQRFKQEMDLRLKAVRDTLAALAVRP